MNIKKKIIIDVRSKVEYEENHIENAINIPSDTLLNFENEILKIKLYIYIVYQEIDLRQHWIF